MTIRSIVKTLIILCLSFIALIILANLIRIVAFEDKPDPIETAVSKALGNEHLVLESKLKLWINDLGNPDLIISCEQIFKYSQFYWLKRGIGVGIDGETNGELANVSDKRIVSILIPTKENTPPVIGKNCKIVTTNETNPVFERVLKASLNGLEIKNIKESDIRKLYANYDASEHFYHNMPSFFSKEYVRLTKYPDVACSINCRDEIHIIKISDADKISLSNIPRFLKRLVLFPYIIVKMILEVHSSYTENPSPNR